MSHLNKVLYCCISITTLLILSLAAKAETLPVDLKVIDVPINYSLGLAFPSGNVYNYPVVKDAGIGTVRITASWGKIQPEEGTFEWQGMDARIKALQQLNLKPFITFESNAPWATHPDTHHIRNGAPLDLNQWITFVEAVVERYNFDGYSDAPELEAPVEYYQVANEWISDQNKSGGWASSTEYLIDHINATYNAVKRFDSDATFVLGGIAAFNLDVLLLAEGIESFTVQQRWGTFSSTTMDYEDTQTEYIQGIINHHFREVLFHSQYDYADAHLYGPQERDKSRIDILAEETNLSTDKIISAECGGPSLDYEDNYSDENHFHAVIDRNLNILASGAKFCLWFGLGEAMSTTWGNQKVPLFDKNNQAKPGYYAYKLLAYLFDGQESIHVEVLTDLSSPAFKISFPTNPDKADIYIGLPSTQSELIAKSGESSFDLLCINALNSEGFITIGATNYVTCNHSVIALGAKLPSMYE
ncbi:hypothetical protein ACMXYX_10515 [Neptuniibacter sp. QD72_48]|uniref:hypothetical protein n=1 Tax=unclassified Neptuniibacter TaxID=2630693 RepID=UPI0039F57AA9